MVDAMLKDGLRFAGGLSRFYLACIKRAFRGKFWYVEKWSGGIALVGAVVTVFVRPSDWWSEVIGTDIPVYFFLAVFCATVLVHFIVGPYLLYSEEKDRADALNSRQLPKLSVAATKVVHQTGATSQTLGGQRISSIQKWTEIASLACTNIGMETLRGCSCRMLKVWRHQNGDWISLPMPEAILISWSRLPQQPQFEVDIDPDETRHAFIASIHPRGFAYVFRDIKALPMEQHRIFGEPGTYELLLQFKSEHPDPIQVLSRLSVAPSTDGLPKYGISISRERSPRLLPQDIEEERQRKIHHD